MESGSVGRADADGRANDDGQWRDIRRKRTTQARVGRLKPKRRPIKRIVFKRTLTKNKAADSAPMMVADFVFRKQIEWMVENTGVRDDFREVAHKIWFSYLSHYMPDLQDGLRRELGGNPYWHCAFPQNDMTVLLNCPKRELAATLEDLRRERGTDGGERGGAHPRSSRLAKDFSHLTTVESVVDNLKAFRPTAVALIAILGIALHVCQEETLISDVLRWARLLHLPLLDLLPYRGSASPAELRGVSELSRALYGAVQYSMVERVVTFLACSMLDEKTNVFPALPVAPFVERFIQELNLPNEMIPFLLGLLDRMNSTEYRIESMSAHRLPSSRRCLNMEGHLMCCIFYALRILFVLDDSAENRISDATERMMTLEPGLNLFNFRLWYQHLMQRRVLLFKHTMLTRGVHSVAAHADFVQSNLISLSVSNVKKLASDRNTQNWKKLLRQLQLGWRESGTSNFSIRTLDLSMTARPFRAHTEALSEYYPSLAVDFSRQTIKHLLQNTSWLEQSALQSALVAEVSAIQSIRKECYRHTQPFRLVRNRGNSDSKKMEKENMSSISQDLVRTMAEMIEQQPTHLFSYLTYLEIIFFPKHPHCTKVGNARNLKKLKA